MNIILCSLLHLLGNETCGSVDVSCVAVKIRAITSGSGARRRGLFSRAERRGLSCWTRGRHAREVDRL